MASPSNFDEIVMRTRLLLRQAEEQVRFARALREVASDLRYENALYREFLTEGRLLLLSRCHSLEEWR